MPLTAFIMGVLMNIFIYDNDADYNTNFIRWYLMNSKEKREWGELEYDLDTAFKIFDGLWHYKKYKQLSLFGK